MLLHNLAPTRALEGVSVHGSTDEGQEQQADGESVAGSEASKATSAAATPEKGAAPGSEPKPAASQAKKSPKKTGDLVRDAGRPARQVASAIAGLARFTAGEVTGVHKKRTAAAYAALLERTLREVFGDDFSHMVPVCNHVRVRLWGSQAGLSAIALPRTRWGFLTTPSQRQR